MCGVCGNLACNKVVKRSKKFWPRIFNWAPLEHDYSKRWFLDNIFNKQKDELILRYMIPTEKEIEELHITGQQHQRQEDHMKDANVEEPQQGNDEGLHSIEAVEEKIASMEHEISEMSNKMESMKQAVDELKMQVQLLKRKKTKGTKVIESEQQKDEVGQMENEEDTEKNEVVGGDHVIDTNMEYKDTHEHRDDGEGHVAGRANLEEDGQSEHDGGRNEKSEDGRNTNAGNLRAEQANAEELGTGVLEKEFAFNPISESRAVVVFKPPKKPIEEPWPSFDLHYSQDDAPIVLTVANGIKGENPMEHEKEAENAIQWTKFNVEEGRPGYELPLSQESEPERNLKHKKDPEPVINIVDDVEDNGVRKRKKGNSKYISEPYTGNFGSASKKIVARRYALDDFALLGEPILDVARLQALQKLLDKNKLPAKSI